MHPEVGGREEMTALTATGNVVNGGEDVQPARSAGGPKVSGPVASPPQAESHSAASVNEPYMSVRIR
jgi:hypothetical protein